MAESRQKTHSILLSVGSKKISIGLYDASQWSDQTSEEGLYRVKIAGRWYTAKGKYTFLSYEAVGMLVARLLAGEELFQEEQPPTFPLRGAVSVSFGECLSSVPISSELGRIVAPPFRGIDGQWYVHVLLSEGIRAVPVYDVQQR